MPSKRLSSSLSIASSLLVPRYAARARRLGHLVGTDLYDAYLEGRLNTGSLRKLFLTHIERTGVAFETYLQLSTRLR